MYINSPMNYTGSKFKLLEQILPLFDYSKNYFVDIFTGGGSIYSNVLDKYDHILINDVINDLIGIHKQLVNNSSDFITIVKKLATTKEDKELYLNLRQEYNDNNSPEYLYALMLSCTNNMLRFNKSGGFNQTWGKRGWNSNTEKKVVDFMAQVSKYKDKINYSSKNFYEIKLTKPCMVYLDPPYTNTEAGYNSYWSVELETKLYEYIKKLDSEGHSFALSGLLGEHKNNKRSKLIDDLIEDGLNYKILDFDYDYVARDKNKKTNSNEILIYNY